MSIELVSLTNLDKAKALVKEASLKQAVEIINEAEALRVYADQASKGLDIQNACAEIKIRAERRAGELLAKMEKHPAGRPSVNRSQLATDLLPKLEDLGISKSDSSRWQLEASLPEEKFKEIVKDIKEKGIELTSTLVRQQASSNKLGIHFSSQTDEWTTPQNIIDATLKTLSFIDLDPCADGNKNIPAKNYFFDNGLEQKWIGKVYMNPPYGNAIGAWIDKLHEEYQKGNVVEAIALVPARTDTEWFRVFRDYPVCFIYGRLKFGNMDNSAPFPSAVFYLGKDIKIFYKSFKGLGDIWIRWFD